MPKKGICKLCGKEKQLSRSHAIPSYFIKGTLNSHGLAYTFDKNNKESPRNIGNVLKDYLLCSECELYLSRTYENPFIAVLKNGLIDNGKSSLKKTIHGHTFKFGSNKLSSIHVINFIISIFWRISLIDIEHYEKFNLPSSCLDWMKGIIKENKRPESRLINIEINTLIDSSGRYPNEDLHQIIFPPFVFEQHPVPVIAMIFGGYLFKMTIPNHGVNNRHGQLKSSTTIYLAKNQDLLKIPIAYETLI